jgi:hypothetical protein
MPSPAPAQVGAPLANSGPGADVTTVRESGPTYSPQPAPAAASDEFTHDPDDEFAGMPPPPEFPPEWETYTTPNRQYSFGVPQPPEAAFFPPEKDGEAPRIDGRHAAAHGGELPSRQRSGPCPPNSWPGCEAALEAITIYLKSTGELERDRRRIKHV